MRQVRRAATISKGVRHATIVIRDLSLDIFLRPRFPSAFHSPNGLFFQLVSGISRSGGNETQCAW